MVIVRLFEQWRQHASENLMRAISVERIELNVFVGESGDVEWLLDKFNLDLYSGCTPRWSIQHSP